MEIGDRLRVISKGKRSIDITEFIVEKITKHLVVLSNGYHTECFNLAHFIEQKESKIEKFSNGSYELIKFSGSLDLIKL